MVIMRNSMIATLEYHVLAFFPFPTQNTSRYYYIAFITFQ